MNFQRLNHILIPATKEGRDAQRDRPMVRLVFGPLARIYFGLTELGRGLLALAFVAGLMGLDVLRGQNYYASAALWTLVFASLGLRRFFGADGLAVEVHAPARAMAGEPIPFRIALRNEGSAPLQALHLRRPFLPWDGDWGPGDRAVPELAAGDHAELFTEATFIARGRHHIDTFGLAAVLPLGLATGPELESRGTRFIVWPRPVHVEGLSFETASSEAARQTPRARAGGESLELLGLRPYRPGDAVRDLHAASWARFGEPVVRAYQAEERARVVVVLDADASHEERLEGAVSVAAGLLVEAAESGAEIVLVVLDDDHPGPVTLGVGRGAVDTGLDALACLRGRSGEPDELSLARHARALRDDDRVCVVTPGVEGEQISRAARFARGAGRLTVFALEPKPPRFASRAGDASDRGTDSRTSGVPAAVPGIDMRVLPETTWSGRHERRRRGA